MSGSTMRVTLRRVAHTTFEASDEDGHRLVVDGPAKLGGEGQGMRPMEMFLVSLAGCSAMDVVMILSQQKEPLEDLRIEVQGRRADAVPAVYEHILLRFVVRGDVSEHKLQRAVRLSVEKYCSVASMLRSEVEVQWEAVREGGAAPAP